MAWDLAWGGASPLAAFFLRDGTIYAPEVVAAYCCASLTASVGVFQWFQTGSPLARFYSMRDALQLLKACALVAALSAGTLFLMFRLETASRSIPVLHFLLLAFGLLAIRLLVRLRDARRDAAVPSLPSAMRHVLIIQATRLAWFFSKMVDELAPGVFQIVAILDERPQMKHRSLNGYPIVGTPADLDKVMANYALHGVRIDQVVLAARPGELSEQAWDDIRRICRLRSVAVEILPERLMAAEPCNDNPTSAEPSWNVATSAPLATPAAADRTFWNIKRTVDVAVAAAVSVLLLPIAIAVCALVAADLGMPVVFWQRRLGRNGTPLFLYKFRTLRTPLDRGVVQTDAPPPSGIGRFLQTTRLDELPQIWNILSGEMSLVGPRPLLPVDQPKDASLRLSVRPGLTGWAQVAGGKLISSEEKTALDEWYIRHASLTLDAIIALRTIRMLFTSDRRDEAAISVALAERSSRRSGDAPDLDRTPESGPLQKLVRIAEPGPLSSGLGYGRQDLASSGAPGSGNNP